MLFLRRMLFLLMAVPACAEVLPGWELVFEDDFKGRRLNTKKWSVIPYEDGVSHIAWRRYQSRDEDLFRLTGNTLRLCGEYGMHRSQSNPEQARQTYACAGIWSRDTFSFRYGKVEVRARFDGVQGCWPAIWLMPTKGGAWPSSGEIDLMEHLNNDAGVYQTVHFCNEGGGAASRTSRRDFADLKLADQTAWHTYGMEWTPAGITFTIDNKITATMNAEQTRGTFGEGCCAFHLIIDQQIGGGWVEGSGRKGIDQGTLAQRGAVLEIDFVRVWSTPEFRHPALSAKRAQSAPAPKPAAPVSGGKKMPAGKSRRKGRSFTSGPPRTSFLH